MTYTSHLRILVPADPERVMGTMRRLAQVLRAFDRAIKYAEKCGL